MEQNWDVEEEEDHDNAVAAMATIRTAPFSPSQTTCSSLLLELQKIWDEIGESESERDKMLLQLEQECLDIYRRKVLNTKKYRDDLCQTLNEARMEASDLVSALGEHVNLVQSEKGTLNEQLSVIKHVVEELRIKKQERIKEFTETRSQIVQIYAEITGNVHSINPVNVQINERDLTMKKLGGLKSYLLELQNEKILRLQKVNSHVNTIHELSVVMSIDFAKTITEVHPTLVNPAHDQTKSISNDTLARLTCMIDSLKKEKLQRLHKLQDLGSTLIELWNLLETSADKQKQFEHVTSLVAYSIDDVVTDGCLALDVIELTEVEVEQLKILKASKIKELVLKRQSELEEIHRGFHMDLDTDAAREILVSLIDSGNVDLSDLLSGIDDQIVKAKEQALSRKDILDKVEKWKHASDEEKWLDDYERDENRYSAGRGAHKNLKRAEKARIVVSKIPSIVENLTARVKAWEMEKGVPFFYDKVPLLQTLEQHIMLRQEREEEKRRSREQKRLQEQIATEQEALFGSKPTTKKTVGQSTNANNLTGTPVGRRVLTPTTRHGVVSGGKEQRDSGKGGNAIPLNYVALPKE